QLRRLTLRDANISDAQLLKRFVDNNDEGAFEALLRRHGSMVFGVCRRILRNVHDAEDAFQSTFLVLLRKSASVATTDTIANWLYGVACRTALKARTQAARRHRREQRAEKVEAIDGIRDITVEFQSVLDQE